MLRSIGFVISITFIGLAHAVEVKPEINGSLDDSCREIYTCDTQVTGTPANAVPTNRYAGMLRITGDYVTVQDLNIQDSAGTFFDQEGSYGILDNIDAEYAFSQIGYFASGLGKESILRDSYFASGNWGRTWEDETDCPSGPSCPLLPGFSSSNGQGGILVRNHRDTFNGLGKANVLIQNNVFVDYSTRGTGTETRYDWQTELINCLQSTHLIVADNKSYGIAPLYSDNCQYAVWERNLAWGADLENLEFTTATLEEYPPNVSPATNTINNDNIVYRNNMIAGGGCGKFGGAEDGALDGGFFNNNMAWIGNTCFSNANTSFGLDNLRYQLGGVDTFGPSAVVEVKSNAIFAPEASGTGFWSDDPSCRITLPAEDIDMDYNAFDDTIPSGKNGLNSKCTSNSLTSSDFQLATTYANSRNFDPDTTPLTVGAFEPGASSPLLGQGDPLLDTEEYSWLTPAEFSSYIITYYLANSPGSCYTEANWKKKLACDAAGVTRDATTPDVGAMEYTP